MNRDNEGLSSLLLRLFSHVSRKRKIQLIFLVGLTIIASLSEVASLGAIVPYIGILTQPERVFNYPALANFIGYLNIPNPAGLVLPITLAFVFAGIIASILRLSLLWTSIQFANATGADLSIDVYRRTLFQPYPVHIARNSSEIVSGITQKVAAATSVLIAAVGLFTAGILFLSILGTLITIDPTVAFGAAGGFGQRF